MSETRVCWTCQEEKSLDQFKPTGKGGRLRTCRACWREHETRMQRERRKDPAVRAKWNKYQREFGQRRRMEALVHYGGDPPACDCCGEDTYEFLVLDHADGGGNVHRAKTGTVDLARWLKANDYPPGYRVLCHNCNMAHGLYGYCPHEREARPDLVPHRHSGRPPIYSTETEVTP